MAKIDSAFKKSELVGRFRWNADFTDELRDNDPWFYTAMHEERLRKAIRKGRLTPKGSFDVLADGELIEEPCSWLALQDWHSYKGCIRAPTAKATMRRGMTRNRFWNIVGLPTGSQESQWAWRIAGTGGEWRNGTAGLAAQPRSTPASPDG